MSRWTYKWHNRMALKYSDKMYPLREDYHMYTYYKAKFEYHIAMCHWYEKYLMRNESE